MPEEAIQVRGARVNNLKNVSFSIPINQMTVVTGVSGSGKSSLAFSTWRTTRHRCARGLETLGRWAATPVSRKHRAALLERVLNLLADVLPVLREDLFLFLRHDAERHADEALLELDVQEVLSVASVRRES